MILCSGGLQPAEATNCRPREDECVIGPDTHATARRLPHLSRTGKTYFVTFVTEKRYVLPPAARDVVFTRCMAMHGVEMCIHRLCVMPDHVHLLFTPADHSSLSHVMWRIKGGSSRSINRLLGRTGRLWQQESFDHIVRSDESLCAKGDYIAQNPVRAGLVADWSDYPWTFPAG